MKQSDDNSLEKEIFSSGLASSKGTPGAALAQCAPSYIVAANDSSDTADLLTTVQSDAEQPSARNPLVGNVASQLLRKSVTGMKAVQRLDLSKLAPGVVQLPALLGKPGIEVDPKDVDNLGVDTLTAIEKLAVEFLNTETQVYEVPTESASFIQVSRPKSQTINRIAFAASIKSTQNKLGSLESPKQKTTRQANRLVGLLRTYRELIAIGVSVLCITYVCMSMLTNQLMKQCLAEGIRKTDAHQYRDAVALLDRSIRFDDGSSDAYLYRGRCHYFLSHYERAFEDYDKYLSFYPNNVEALEKHAGAAVVLNKNEIAVRDYTKLLQLQPYIFDQGPAPLTSMGLAFRRTNQFELCLQYLTKCLHMFPKNTTAYIERALCYQGAGQYNKAINDCANVLKIDPDNVGALVVRARTNQLANDFVHDLKDLNKAILLKPQDSLVHLYRGLHYAHFHAYDQSMADFNLAVAYDSKNEEAYKQKAILESARGDVTEALHEYMKIASISHFRATPAFYMQRAQLLMRLHRYQSAIQDLQLAAVIDWQHPSSYLLKSADCHGILKQYGLALSDCKKVLALEPRNSEAMVKSGVYQKLSGNQVSAIDQYFKAIAIDPNNAEAYLRRGEIYLSNKQYSSAAADFRRALRINSSLTDAREKLALCESKSSSLATVSAPRMKRNGLSKAQLAELGGMNLAGLLSKGYDSLHRGDIEYALVAFLRAVQLDPSDRPAHRYLFSAYVANSEGTEAAAQLGALLGMGRDPDDELAMAKTLITIGSEAQCKNAFDRLIDKYSTEPAALVKLAQLCQSEGYKESASLACTKGLQQVTAESQIQELRGIQSALAKELADQATAAKLKTTEEQPASRAEPKE